MPAQAITRHNDHTTTGQTVVVLPRRRTWPWILLLVLALFVGGAYAVVHGLSSWNPFQSQTTDRSSPVVLQSIRDLNRFVAAEGEFQVIVDVQQSRQNIPTILYGERTVLVAVGTVDAYVDFSGVDDSALAVDGTTARMTLPPPSLETPSLDTQRSYVLAHEQGIGNRIAGLFANGTDDQIAAYQEASQKISQAAGQSDLTDRAKASTTTMLTNLLHQLGYVTVTVTYDSTAGQLGR